MNKQRRQPSRSSQQTTNQLRIIGGQWRGRKLNFPSVDGLRPSPDRVRETLFNWLIPVISGAHCLDLFAGSGALGLEALSRGAASVTLVDNSRDVSEQLKKNLGLLEAKHATVIQQPALTWLQSSDGKQYDVVFLDPPFGKGLAQQAIEHLEQNARLSNDAWIYLETGSDESAPAVPSNWLLHRDKQAGQVCYRLFHVTTT